jgi:hypothetical protein
MAEIKNREEKNLYLKYKLLDNLTIVATSGQNIMNETPSLPVDA